MTIIAFSDIHGAYDRVAGILKRRTDYDIIVLAGDMTTAGTPLEAEEALALFQAVQKPLVAIAGNMDPHNVEAVLRERGVLIDSDGRVIDNTGFFGVSGSPRTPMHTPYELDEEEIGRRAEAGWHSVRHAAKKVFVPHAPPYNTKLDRIFLGKHVGSTAVRGIIETKQPDVVICGHIHESRGIDTVGSVQIVNCGPAGRGYYALIHLDNQISIELCE